MMSMAWAGVAEDDWCGASWEACVSLRSAGREIRQAAALRALRALRAWHPCIHLWCLRTLCSSFDVRQVDKTKEYIQAGDIFQLVLSQRFERRTFADPFEIYRSLRVVNPSPYMAYLQVGLLCYPGSHD